MALDPFVTYYQRELTYLRRASTEFAQKYPKIARRLEMGHGESTDPHVERLIESFAYLTAGLQKEVDDHFPRITTALLDVLYPHLVNPTPSMAIAQYAIDPDQGQHTSGYVIERDNPVLSRSDEGDLCHFKTCYPVELWPIKVAEAAIVPTGDLPYKQHPVQTSRVLRLRMEAQTLPFKKIGGPGQLRFYIEGDRATQNMMFEVLFKQQVRSFVVPNAQTDENNGELVPQLAGHVEPVGFNEDEYVIPTAAPAHPAYRILQEYFSFPHKFFFFDIVNIPYSDCDTTFDILIEVPDDLSLGELNVDRQHFMLGCTPIINLFKQTSEPLKMDHKSHEYRLVADYRRESITEIHSVLNVKYVEDEEIEPKTMGSYFSYNHYERGQENSMFWYARRAKSLSEDIPGKDVFLSFVDFDFQPEMPPSKTVYAEVMCTNRLLATQMPKGARMESEYPVPLDVVCIEKPTHQIYPPEDGETQWQLISHLALNHLPLGSHEKSTKAFKEILYLYAHLAGEKVHPELENLKDMNTRQIVRRVQQEAWRGFSQGTAIDLTFKEDAFGPGGAVLFGYVLNEFLALYSAVNSFVELSLINEGIDGVWKKWQPNRGDRFLL